MPARVIFISRLCDRVTCIIIFSECEADLAFQSAAARCIDARSPLALRYADSRFSNRIPVSHSVNYRALFNDLVRITPTATMGAC